MELGFSQQAFEKSSNTKFHENPSSGSRDIPYGPTDMKKLIVIFRNFAGATKNVLDSVTVSRDVAKGLVVRGFHTKDIGLHYADLP